MKGHPNGTRKSTQARSDHHTTGPPLDEKQRLLERYGDHLEGEDLSEAQKAAFLMALWQIMRAFAEAGFNLKPGEKLLPESDGSFDDVLRYLIPEDTAPETVAPHFNQQNEEQP